MKIKLIFYYLRWFLLPLAISNIFIICFSYFDNLSNQYQILPYFLAFCLQILLFFICGAFKTKQIIDKINLQILVLIGWIVIPIFISIPYFFSNYNLGWFESYYESFSGFLSFGFSIFDAPHLIDKLLLLWRSLSQWLGGFYFLFSIISILSTTEINFVPHKYISINENSLNFENKFLKNFFNIFYCYFLLSLIILFFLNFTSLNFFSKLNLMMTIISSGGFLIQDYLLISNTQDSLIISFCFLLSSLNIFIFYELFKFSKNYNFNEDIYIFIMIFVISFLIIFIFPTVNNFHEIFLMVTTSISTSGLPLSLTPNPLLVNFFIILTFFGGCIYSTGSGFKFLRILFFGKKFLIEITKLLNPSIIIKKNIFNSTHSVKNSDYYIASLMFIFYLIIFFLSILVLSFENLSFENIYKIVFLTLNNTLPYNYITTKISFYELYYHTHVMMLFLLLVSKVYFISFLVLVKKLFWK